MKFKVGDKVRVISLSKITEQYPRSLWHSSYIFTSEVEGCRFTQGMLEFCGLVGTIVDKWITDDETYRYSLSFGNGEVSEWSWVPEFFEPAYVSSFEEAYET